MDVLQTLSINGSSYPVHNDSDYYLDEYLDSDYGFELFYRKGRGIGEVRWDTLLTNNGFKTGRNTYKRGYLDTETRQTTIAFREYMTKPFVFHWVSGGNWYGLAFDGHEFMIQNNHGNFWLPDRVL